MSLTGKFFASLDVFGFCLLLLVDDTAIWRMFELIKPSELSGIIEHEENM